MDTSDDFIDFIDKYRKEFPEATNATIRAEYFKTKPCKQAINTRLLQERQLVGDRAEN
jgi:hypothetical protein